MEKTQEFIAELLYANGKFQREGSNTKQEQKLDARLAEEANDKSNFTISKDNIIGTIKEVVYRIKNYPFSTPIDTVAKQDHKLTFQEYVELGRPREILIKETLSYEPATTSSLL